MKFILPQNLETDPSISDLDLKDYLHRLEYDIPILSNIELTPLDGQSLDIHFSNLKKAKNILEVTTYTHDQILEVLKEIPPLDNVLHAIADATLDPISLYYLGRYFYNTERLRIMLDLPTTSVSSKVLYILRNSLTEDFSSFKHDQKIKCLLLDFGKLGYEFSEKVSEIEKNVFTITNIQMIYPYPKELILNPEQVASVKTCPNILIEQQNEKFRLKLTLPHEIKKIEEDREHKRREIITVTTRKLKELCEQLRGYAAPISRDYCETKDFIYAITLAMNIKRYNLTIPSNDFSIEIKEGELFTLKKTLSNYQPLTLNLDRGPSVILGHHMAGKTTLLKTLYFLLILGKMGIPVPATSMAFPFESNIYFHLKNSGNIHNRLSSFTEEITFLGTDFSERSIILSDEFFSSTNPLAASFLTKTFLEYFSDNGNYFIFTSHLLDLDSADNLAIYQMSENLHSPKESLKQQYFTITKIDEINRDRIIRESLHPLKIALQYKLPPRIIHRIKNKIEG